MPTQDHPEYDEIDFEQLDFESDKEEWNEYTLEDGTTLKVRTVVNRIMRSTEVENEMGEPIYQVSSQIIVRPIESSEGV